MAEENDNCDSSTFSDPGTVTSQSSSGLEQYDVAIFCHAKSCAKAEDAEKILSEESLTTCISYRDIPAARSKLANLYSVAKHSKFRVFIVTKDFIGDDFPYHMRLLENAEISTKKNTLILLNHRSLLQHIPGHVRDLTCNFFDGRVDGEGIATFVAEFIQSQQCGFQDETDEEADGVSVIEESPKIRDDGTNEYEKEFEKFKETFGKVVTKKRCYILISSPIRESSQSLKFLASVPWVRVFDFDNKSSQSGLLLWVDDNLSKKNHTKTYKSDPIETPDDSVMNWVSIAEDADGGHSRNIAIPEHVILGHGTGLADYCLGQKIPTILVMWYPSNSNMDKTLDGFLSGLRHHFMGRLNSFKCIVCMKEMPNKRTPLYKMLQRLNIAENIIVVPVTELCNWLQSCSNSILETSTKSVSKLLPKYPAEGEEVVSSVEIEEEELVWIRSQLYILVQIQRNEIGEEDEEAQKAVETLGRSFLRGCEIKWDLVEYGSYDVRRDLLKEVKEYIEEKHINPGKSGLITIYHAPGGGGTTFARRLLFELRKQVPCGELISDRIALKNLESRLTTLRNLTLLPTVILLDGKSIREVKKLQNIGTKLRVIVIHVRRHIHSEKPTGMDKFFLHGYVSQEEASGLAEVYKKVAPQKEKLGRLKSLFDISINKRGTKPYIFEYGLITFESQFQGVRKYVHGYLQVHEKPGLQNWHTILVFLSMADYYGHRGLPCKLFSKILEKNDSDTVELDDLPHAALQFITEENENWKITRYVMSKLILEQVLVRRHTTDYEATANTFTKEASQELSPWAIRFIENIKNYVGNSRNLTSHIWEILTSVFIRRNYEDPGENETGWKTHYSKLLEDINSSEKQKVILNHLVESFPDQAEFRAHLGRLYSKQGQFEEAEKCFKEALETRKREIRGQDVTYVATKHHEQPKGDDVLERVYNMSAFACLSHIKSKIGARMGKIRPVTLRGKLLPTLIQFCLKKADQAIKFFESGRLYYQSGSNPSFANLGELKVRLHLSELAKVVSNDDFKSLEERPSPYKELYEFVMHSFHECDRLLAQCISHRSRKMDIPEEEINFCFNQFNFFYENATAALEHWAGNDKSIHSMKCHLSILKAKLKDKSKKYFRLNEDVKTKEEIQNLVDLCEKICDTVWKYGASHIKISSYMMEWLRAIRHRFSSRRYSQMEVLSRVEKWKDKKETWTLANFYYYVVLTVLSLDSISRETANTYAETSRKMKERMRQNDSTPFHLLDTNEWLGTSDNPNDFNRLIHSTDLGEWNGKFWVNPDKIARLQVCSGSILFCRPHDGIITLDGGRDPPIHVFFVPQKYDIGLSHSRKKTRVEFYLGFNPRHFAEAYEVKLLNKYPCPNPSCKAPTEISVLGKSPHMQVALCNLCETVVKVPSS